MKERERKREREREGGEGENMLSLAVLTSGPVTTSILVTTKDPEQTSQ